MPEFSDGDSAHEFPVDDVLAGMCPNRLENVDMLSIGIDLADLAEE